MVIYFGLGIMTEPRGKYKEKNKYLKIKSLKLNHKHTTLHFNNKKV